MGLINLALFTFLNRLSIEFKDNPYSLSVCLSISKTVFKHLPISCLIVDLISLGESYFTIFIFFQERGSVAFIVRRHYSGHGRSLELEY